MTRLLSSNQVFHQLNTLSRLDDTADTGVITTTPVARGDTTIELNTGEGANFAAGDDIRVGPNGNTAWVTSVTSIATDTLTVDDPAPRAFALGVTVTELTAIDLGALDENGVQLQFSSSEVEIQAGTQRAVYLFISGPFSASATFAMRDFAPENLAEMLGMDDTDAEIVHTNGVNLAFEDVVTRGFKPYKAEGILENGNAVTGYIWALKVTAVDATIQLAHGVASITPVNARLVSGVSFQIA